MGSCRFFFLIAVLVLPFAVYSQQVRELAVFDFPTTATARAAWVPGTGVAAVGLFDGDGGSEKPGVWFPCNFTEVSSRCSWDFTFSEDFTESASVGLRIYIEDPSPVSSLTLYFRSGDGWFFKTYGNLKKGWQELRTLRSDFGISGEPDGWDSINGIRFSPWKAQGTEKDTYILANNLTLSTPAIIVIRGTRSTAQNTADSTADLIHTLLDYWEIEYGGFTEEDVEAGALSGARLAIFPYSNNMSVTEIARIESFVASGGKFIIFFTAPDALFNLLGLQNLGSAGISTKAMQFQNGIVDCIPPIIGQASWNFFRVTPVAPDAQVLAYWLDTKGEVLEWPAWTIANNGAYMSHILLADNMEDKKKLLLALVTHFVPEISDEVVRRAIASIGEVGEYTDYEKALTGINASAQLTPRAEIVGEYLTSTTLLRTAAIEEASSNSTCDSLDLVYGSRECLAEAYYLAQKPVANEFRAAWASYNSSSGPYVDGWEDLADTLSTNGFHAIIPYFATGGVAYYDSQFLPHAEVFDLRGDQLAACIEACKSKGIETHVRKLNWFLHNTPQSFIDEMRAQERTQVDVEGNPVDSLCPSNVLNYELELNVMLEIVDNYDVDGIHYDFIRYPNERTCYCDECKERFQQDTGLSVTDWPMECYSGILKEQYREWRREQITRVVRSMREALDERKSDVQISAAVFSGYPACRTTVAQDWVSWIENGYLDFVCPMSYTNSQYTFRSLLEGHMEYVKGIVPLRPGVGVVSSNSSLSPDQTIAQLRIARELETDGYVLFVYNGYLAEDILPALRKGLTATPGISAFLSY